MEEDIANNNTDTIPIPQVDIKKKTVPVFCPWCQVISGIAKTDVVRSDNVSRAFRSFYALLCQVY